MIRPKLLLLDIETAPATAYTWRTFDVTISLDQLLDPGRVICAAWKFHDKPGIEFAADWDKKKHKHGVWFGELYDAMCEADAIVTYNGDRFDIPKLHGEFLRAKLPPPTPVASIDLYKTVKKLGFLSGKLEFVGPYLEIGKKVKHEGFKLWSSVLAGDEAAQDRMERYNKQDTRLLGGLYTRLRPYIKHHPFMGTGPSPDCPVCGSSHLQHRGHRRTKAFLIERLQCQTCGSWSDGGRKKMGGKK